MTDARDDRVPCGGTRHASLVAWNRTGRQFDDRARPRRARIAGLVLATAGAAALGFSLDRGMLASVPGAVVTAAGVFAAAAPRHALRAGATVAAASRALVDALGFAAMIVVYLAAVTPLGALLRARRRVRLALGPDPARTSYFEARRVTRSDPSRPI